MNNVIKRVWNKNAMVNIEDLRGMAFQAESGGHTFQISGIDGDGNPVALSGTPAGVMLRSDNQDVALTCSISDGKVNATLPANAYSLPGRFGITIFLTSDGQKTAIYAAVGTVGKTSSGTVAPPAGSDVVDLVNAIAAAVATIPASYTDLMAAMAPTYSSSGLYAVGSYAWYNGKLYRCTTAITSGETWTSGHWTLANLGSDLVDLKSALLLQDGSESIGYIDGKIINTGSNSTVNVNNLVDYASGKCAVVACNPGDVFIISGAGTSPARIWCFTDSSYNVLKRNPSSNTPMNMVRITAPPSAAWLVLNSTDKTKYSFKKNTIDNRAKNIEQLIKEIEYNTGFVIDTSGSTVDTTALIMYDATQTEGKCAVVECNAGDEFTVSGTTSDDNNYRIWCFLDASKNVLSASFYRNTSVDNQLIVAPTNAKYLVLNSIDKTKKSYYGKTLDKRITSIESFVDSYNNDTESQSIEYINNSIISTSGASTDFGMITHSGWKCAVVPCVEGDIFTISGYGSSSARLWAFVNSSLEFIQKASSSTDPVTDLQITAPENAAYLILNSGNINARSFKGIPVGVQIKNVQPDYLRMVKIAELPKIKEYDVFAFAGQSNMMGASAIPPTDIAKNYYSFEYLYNPKRKGAATGQFVDSHHSAGEWSYKNIETAYASGNVDSEGRSKTTNYSSNTYFVSAMSNKSGEGTVAAFSTYSESTAQIGQSIPPLFANEYATYGRPCIYAHMAKGSTSIDYYLTEANKTFFADKFASMLQDFQTLMPGCTMGKKCFVWCQGEADYELTKVEYKAKLETLWTWAQTLGFEKFFCIRVGYWGNTAITNIMSAQEEFCEENQNCYIVTRAMSYMLYPGMDVDTFYTRTPGEEYQYCRDSYYGYDNRHINEKGDKLVAKRMAANIYRVLHEGTIPVLEDEMVSALIV